MDAMTAYGRSTATNVAKQAMANAIRGMSKRLQKAGHSRAAVRKAMQKGAKKAGVPTAKERATQKRAYQKANKKALDAQKKSEREQKTRQKSFQRKVVKGKKKRLTRRMKAAKAKRTGQPVPTKKRAPKAKASGGGKGGAAGGGGKSQLKVRKAAKPVNMVKGKRGGMYYVGPGGQKVYVKKGG